ncbi:helix-turn-helix domain-containing protein [Candidatus Pacearchaeota archaeon]|nr:helix-turn-helix domain-containing protein [Candidatus Pacearchaeota archaeon]
MSDKYIMVDMDDPRAATIADVISNKTSKKILLLLAEKEMSESEIADALKLPMNTIGYNIKKLVESGLIERVSGFLWSTKGKRIHKYTLSEKKILISPRKMMKGILPALFVTAAIALGIKLYQGQQVVLERTNAYAAPTINAASESLKTGAAQQAYDVVAHASNAWAWFFVGALAALSIYLLWNYVRER